MLLKICYKPNGFYYVNDVSSIDFDSATNTKYVYSTENKIIYYNPDDSDNPILNAITLVDDEYLVDEVGAIKHANADTMYFINNITFKTKEQATSTDYCFIAFTGTAYLCDDNGKTIDVLR